MFQNLNDSNKNDNNDKNLRFMMLSASVLIGLFIYTSIKSDNVMENGSYFVGIIFLLVLMVLAFYLNKYKEKVRAMIPSNKFQDELLKAEAKIHKEEVQNSSCETNTTINPIVSDIKFENIAGIESIKEELEEIVDFLHNPKKYTMYGAKLPKGVLLVGPPGVGKTLIARAVAGEANVPFFYQSGANFVHIYVGMGAKRVQELFTKAKSSAPSIVFIDEIDAIGKSRNGGSNDEREATLNELLTQMDGFDGVNGVIVIAATNKIEVLDEALLRAGRFDRRVFLSLPSLEDREKILKLYTKNKQIDFNLEKLANETSGFNSAALATLINEALLNMVKRKDYILNEEDINIAKQKVQYGKKQLSILTIEQKEVLATYQASKAFIIQKTVHLFDDGIQDEDILYPSKSQLIQRIKGNLAGSTGIEIFYHEPYAIFPNELLKGKKIASEMVDLYGMGSESETILLEIKKELQVELQNNVEAIKKLKCIMLKDETIIF